MLAPLASPDSARLRVIDHPLYREGIVRALEAARQPGLVR